MADRKSLLDSDLTTRRSPRLSFNTKFVCFILLSVGLLGFQGFNILNAQTQARLSVQATTSLARCLSLSAKPGPSPSFHKRTESDRFAVGTKALLLKNAKVWTGEKNGTEVIEADILLDKGLIKGIGHVRAKTLAAYQDIEVVDVKGAWVTPGIVDLHSHLGDASSPATDGASGDDNSIKGPIQPWLRSLDGLNTHDDSYLLSISGGVTTSLVLPGSANAIGGQGFTIKLRQTAERSPSSMLLEPPHQINSSFLELTENPPWRQMKHACGENPSRVYGQTRMDTIWQFREAYNKAREIKHEQDQYCARVLNGEPDVLNSPYPEDLQWEALVDVLRGRVKVQIHCYETVDLDDIVRLSNEFQFPIAAFHHAHEAYLVPDVLKSAYGHPPGVAMFATNARYKRESWRGSEFAPRILAEAGLKVVMKSDHPVLDSRYLLYEAQQAYLYGLPENLALAAVTTTPAGIMGMDHRVGYIKEGWDADLVVWDSHPLALGATPKQVYIDGIPQLRTPHNVAKSHAFQELPRVPNFDQEAKDAVKYEGLPPLKATTTASPIVVFTNVGSVFTRLNEGIEESFRGAKTEFGVVVVENGAITCSGSATTCSSVSYLKDLQVIDLKGGSIAPGLVTFGAPLGLEEIQGEGSTHDGAVLDPFEGKIPSIVGGDKALIRAVDGLQYGGRDTLYAYRAGVTTGIVAPTHYGFYGGLSTSFSTGALHKLAEGAVLQEVTALHVSVRHFGSPSVSSQIGALRRLLLDPDHRSDAGKWFRGVSEGRLTLAVEADSADIIATLILLKKEVEAKFHSDVQLTIIGGLEAHLVAKELAAAHVGVLQVPSRPFPAVWEKRRILPGLPLSEKSSVLQLLAHNVTVGVGIQEAWSARNTRFDVGWIAVDAGGQLSRVDALALGSTNVAKLLGQRVQDYALDDMVVTEGGDLLDFSSKVVAIVSPRRGLVDLL